MGCTCGCEHDRDQRMLIVAEVLRWVVMVVPLYLGIWRYTAIRGGYTIFIKDVDEAGQFWGIVTLIIVGSSLLIYLPGKIAVSKRRAKKSKILMWRPSILTYILFSAAPVLIMIVYASKQEGQDDEYMDSTTVVILQVTVLGLTLTEWMSKLREEHLTFDLVGSMADDFFFAYDVIDFIMMATHEAEIYHSVWVYICFGFSFIAMFKYLPAQPVNILGEGGPRSRVAILVSMFCSDVPFVIIRLWTMIVYDFRVSDLLHPIKNLALIVFDIMQLVIIHKHRDMAEPPQDVSDGITPLVAPQNRRTRADWENTDAPPRPASATDNWNMIRRRVLRSPLPQQDSGPHNEPVTSSVHNDAFDPDIDEDEPDKFGSLRQHASDHSVGLPGEIPQYPSYHA